MVYCMFEQSGTFKNEFRKLGMEAIDLDILNEFGETDKVIDLFDEINKGYEGKPSVFDEINKDDLIFAFFPCTRFAEKVPLLLRTQLAQMQNWDDAKRLEYSRKTMEEVNRNYQLVCKLWLICIRRGLRLIMENPYTQPHFLTMYSPIQPKVIHKDRTLYGDYYRKPTQYWFIGCEPKDNLILEDIRSDPEKILVLDQVKGGKKRQMLRSMISPVYANRFIREYILEEG